MKRNIPSSELSLLVCCTCLVRAPAAARCIIAALRNIFAYTRYNLVTTVAIAVQLVFSKSLANLSLLTG